MSEHAPNMDAIGEPDEFDKMMAGFEDDADFSSVVEGLNDDMDSADFETLSSRHLSVFDRYAIPHTEESIDDVAVKISELFQRLCREQGIDPNTSQHKTADYVRIQEDIADEVYAMKKEIWAGDIITVTDSLIVNLDGVPGEMDVLGVFNGDKVIGSFVTPLVGPMPDETVAITLGCVSTPAMGVGLMLENPAVINAEGEIFPDYFKGNKIILALGILGSKFTKYNFPKGD